MRAAIFLGTLLCTLELGHSWSSSVRVPGSLRHTRRVRNTGTGLLAKRSKGLGEIANPSTSSSSSSSQRRADPEKAAAADRLVDALVAECAKERDRDVGAIARLCSETADLVRETPGLLAPSQVEGDWRLIWVSNDDAFTTIGSGLHKLPLTLMEDIFVSFRSSGKSKAPIRKVETAEILRVLGPFPNVRNTLSGSWSLSSAPRPAGGLGLVYDTMTDGNGGTIKAPDGSETRSVPFDVAYANGEALVLLNDRTTGSADPQILLFAKETDLEGTFKALRVDRPDDWDQPNTKPGFKFPWDKA